MAHPLLVVSPAFALTVGESGVPRFAFRDEPGDTLTLDGLPAHGLVLQAMSASVDPLIVPGEAPGPESALEDWLRLASALRGGWLHHAATGRPVPLHYLFASDARMSPVRYRADRAFMLASLPAGPPVSTHLVLPGPGAALQVVPCRRPQRPESQAVLTGVLTLEFGT